MHAENDYISIERLNKIIQEVITEDEPETAKRNIGNKRNMILQIVRRMEELERNQEDFQPLLQRGIHPSPRIENEVITTGITSRGLQKAIEYLKNPSMYDKERNDYSRRDAALRGLSPRGEAAEPNTKILQRILERAMHELSQFPRKRE